MNTDTDRKTKLHCGLAPFIDAYGNKVASYQAVDTNGEAVATVCFYGEKVEQFLCVASVNRAEFLRLARAAFDATQATVFLNTA